MTLEGLHVLLVDDNDGIRVLIRTMASRDGVDVVAEAADGYDAIEKARIHRPQVVLLDIDMPGLDGISAIPAILRASPASPASQRQPRGCEEGFLRLRSLV